MKEDLVARGQSAPQGSEHGDLPRPGFDVVCDHGTAMDVHCCGCHSGFLFDIMACTCAMPDWGLTAAQERDVLCFDPWGERDATYRTLRSVFGVVRADHQCAICFAAIRRGDRVWLKSEVDDGKAMTFRFCAECCWCIAHRNDDSEEDPCHPWERLDERWDIGYRRARRREVEAANEKTRSASAD